MLPCGLATGIEGLLPIAGSAGTPCSLRQKIAAAPTSATSRANKSEKLIPFPHVESRANLVEARAGWNRGPRDSGGGFVQDAGPMQCQGKRHVARGL